MNTLVLGRPFGLRLPAWLLALVVPVALACGPVRLIATYDEVLDRSATALQKQMDSFLSTLERKSGPEATFGPNAQFYTDYAVELRSLRIRAGVTPKNSITVTQIDLMTSSLEELRKLHEQQPLSPASIGQFRNLFNQGWQAILTLELAKQRGEAKE